MNSISKSNLIIKRIFDLILSILIIPVFIIPIVILILISTIDLKQIGVFSQRRVGQHGKIFMIYKIKTLRNNRVTKISRFFRDYKLDELPQVFNILIGDMSFVGPRPDIIGFADQLKGENRIVLQVKPGITGPATIKYRNEEGLLSNIENPEKYNRDIIWKDKVEINKNYVKNWNFFSDMKYLIITFFNFKYES